MPRKYRCLVLGALVAAVLVVYFSIDGHPRACTSRDCGTRGSLVPAGQHQPSLLKYQDSMPSAAKQISQEERKKEPTFSNKKDIDEGNDLLEGILGLKPNIEEMNDAHDTSAGAKKDKVTEQGEEYLAGLEIDISSRTRKPKHEDRTQLQNRDRSRTSDAVTGDTLAHPHDSPAHMLNDFSKSQGNDLRELPDTPHKTPHQLEEGTRLQSNDIQSNVSVYRHPHVVRDCVTREIVGQIVEQLELQPFDPLDPSATEETPLSRQRSFQHVFDTRAWGHGWDQNNKGLNASGMGATLYWSQELMATLHAVVDDIKEELGVQRVTVLDAPCGDIVWMHRFLQTRDDIMYTGMDIVPELIRHHEKEYPASKYPQRRFIHGDLVALKQVGRYHIILCRMMMQHLPYFDVRQVLQKISASGSHVALMTSINSDKNEQLHLDHAADNPGRFRVLNLELPPYNLEPPLCLQRDGPPDVYQGWDHFIGLWKLPLHVLASCPYVHRNRWKQTDHILYSCTLWKNPP